MPRNAVWVDSDPSVKHQASILQKQGLVVQCFTEVQPALEFISEHLDSIEVVLTSSMKRDGRAERGLPSGFDLADRINTVYGKRSYKPLLAFITMTADMQEVLERGFTIFVKGDRQRIQHEIVKMLTESVDRDFRINRALSLGCDNKTRNFARRIVDFITGDRFSDHHNAFADLCFAPGASQREFSHAPAPNMRYQRAGLVSEFI